MRMNGDILSQLAYVGPGPGLTMVWAFIVLLGTIALAFLSLLAWPIRMLIRKMRGTPPANAGAEANRQTDPNAPTTPPPSNVDARSDTTTP